MTFLNATLMFGLGAMAIPLVLHLISKREPKTVSFPAVRFLTSSYQSNRSRLQVRRWWLLALRMLAIAAVAVTLARPAISRSLSTTWISIGILVALGVVLLIMAAVAYSRGQAKSLSLGLLGTALLTLVISLFWGGATVARGPTINVDAQAPAAIAIVIDNSPTSAWMTNGESHLQRHIAMAVDLLSRFAPTSRIAILDRSPTPASFSIDMASAISKIESLSTREVAVPIESRLDAAIRLVRTSDLESRHVFVLTDLAESTWAGESNSVRSTLAQAESPVAVTIIDAVKSQGLNRRLGLPRLSDQTPPRESPSPVSMVVSLETFGEVDPAISTAETPITAEMLLYEYDPTRPLIRDGELVLPATRNVDRTSVRLTPGQSAEMVLTIPPLKIGTHHGLVRLVGDDPYTPDDERHFTVRVLPPTRLLVVGSVPDETLRIAQVIAAPAAWDDMNAEFTIDRINFDDLLPTRLDDYAAAVLLDPPGQAFAGSQLIDYASRGGGLLVCLGPAAASMRSDASATAGGLLPTLSRRWRVPDPGTFLQVVRESHPAIAPLELATGGVPWNQFLIQQYWKMETAEEDLILMSYASTEHAALVERIIRRDSSPMKKTEGRVLVLSTPLPALAGDARSWNQLFGSESWPAFYLVRDLVGYVSGRDAQSSTTAVGQPHVVSIDATNANSDANDDATSKRLQLFTPGRTSAVPLTMEPGETEVVIAEVNQSGTYWLRGDDVYSGFSAHLPEQFALFDRIDPSTLDEWFGADQYSLTGNMDDIDFSRGGQSQSILLQSPAMLLALIVFLLEQVLSNRFYRSPASVPRQGMAPA